MPLHLRRVHVGDLSEPSEYRENYVGGPHENEMTIRVECDILSTMETIPVRLLKV